MREKLPDKWYIRTNAVIDEVLIKWRQGTYDDRNGQIVLRSEKFWDSLNVNTRLLDSHEEISFEEFRRLVLKENINTNYLIY